MQVEQFIESIFPTPVEPKAVAARAQMRATGQTPEQAAAAKKETMLLIGAIVATLSVISGIMVRPYASILFP